MLIPLLHLCKMCSSRIQGAQVNKCCLKIDINFSTQPWVYFILHEMISLRKSLCLIADDHFLPEGNLL